MKVAISLMAAALVAAPAAAQEQPPAPTLDRIEFELRSWGRPVASWTIEAGGAIRRTVPEPKVFQAEHIVTRAGEAGSAGFGELRGMLAAAEARAGGELPCERRITDAAYGEVRWVQPGGSVSVLKFDAGCQGDAAIEVIAALARADDRAEAWTAAGEIVERRAVEPAR